MSSLIKQYTKFVNCRLSAAFAAVNTTPDLTCKFSVVNMLQREEIVFARHHCWYFEYNLCRRMLMRSLPKYIRRANHTITDP